MQLEHRFEVPVAVDDAWAILTDLERVVPCMPGASLDEADGDSFRGRVRVKVGPIQLTYRGSARFTERDEDAHRAVIEASGQETRGSGTAQATITATCEDRDGTTAVTVVTDLAITGRPAQFGRGVMADVGDKLLGSFAECLAEEVAGGRPVAEPEQSTEPSPAPSPEPSPAAPPRAPRDEAIDLLDVAGGSIVRRAAPVALALALVALVWWLVRR